MIRPMILKQSGKFLHIRKALLDKLIESPKPILWCNDGLYGIIPIEKMRNELQHIQDLQKAQVHIPELRFYWNHVVEIPQETGRALEKYNGGKDHFQRAKDEVATWSDWKKRGSVWL